MSNPMLVKLCSEEERRCDELMKLIIKYEAILDALKKEMREIVYKLDRKI